MASPAAPSDAKSARFPQSQEEFDGDPRVSYSRLDNKYILEQYDGSEWEYNEHAKQWIPMVCPSQSLPMRSNAKCIRGPFLM